MNPCELTLSITALANAIACKLESPEEIALVAAVFMQLGDTLEVIAAQQDLCKSRQTDKRSD